MALPGTGEAASDTYKERRMDGRTLTGVLQDDTCVAPGGADSAPFFSLPAKNTIFERYVLAAEILVPHFKKRPIFRHFSSLS